MTFLDAVTHMTADLTDDSRAGAAPAAARLVIEAWPVLAEDVPAWDVVGLVVLDVAERLFPGGSVVVHTDPPGNNRPAESAAVRDLVTALAAWCSRRASARALPLSDRLTHDAAAVQLRRAVAALP
jgi:hypothetical protein